MKDRMNSEINSQLDRYSSLKIKFDDLTLELRHTEEKVRDRKNANEDLTNRLRATSDELHKEIERIREENDRKRDQIEKLIRDNKNLEEAGSTVNSANRSLEADLAALRKTHEFTVNELSNAIRRLEQDNYTLSKIKEDLDRKNHEKSNEGRNLNFDYKYQKEEGLKRENQLNEKNNKLESELVRERENYRHLMGENTELTKQYEEMVKQKERQAREIQDLRERELTLENRIRQAHEDYTNRDLNDLKNLTHDHSVRRQEHIDALREMLRQLEDNMTRVQGCSDMRNIEESVTHFKRRMVELEAELKNKDSKTGELVGKNFNQRLDTDVNRRARSDFETENKNLQDVRANYDKLLLEHSRLKSENQTLDRQCRDARAELQNVNERRWVKDVNKSPSKRED